MGSDVETYHIELVTGGNTIERLTEAVMALPGKGRGWLIDVQHDEGCPAVVSDIVSDCNCEIVICTAQTPKVRHQPKLFRTDKVPEQYQAVYSTGRLGWKPPLLKPDASQDVREYWRAVTENVKIPESEREYWRRRVG